MHTEAYLNSLKNSVNVSMITEVLCSIFPNAVVLFFSSTKLIFALLDFFIIIAIIKCVYMTAILLKNGIILNIVMITWFLFIIILGSWGVCLCHAQLNISLDVLLWFDILAEK